MATNEKRDQLDKFYDRLQTLPALVGNLGLSIAEAQKRLDQNYIESLSAFTKIISAIKNNLAADALDVVNRANNAVTKAGALDTKEKAADAVIAAATAGLGAQPSAEATAIVNVAKGSKADAVLKATALEAAQHVAKTASDKFVELAKTSGQSPSQYLELYRAIAPSHYQFTETAVEVRADLRVASASELTLGAELGINKGVFSVAVNFSYLKRSASDYHAAADLKCVINAIPSDHTMLNDLFARAGSPISANFKADASFAAMLEALNEMKQLPPAP